MTADLTRRDARPEAAVTCELSAGYTESAARSPVTGHRYRNIGSDNRLCPRSRLTTAPCIDKWVPTSEDLFQIGGSGFLVKVRRPTSPDSTFIPCRVSVMSSPDSVQEEPARLLTLRLPGMNPGD
ncbi:hypothetical protein J6590_005631 [Homalodisca vitripennis]|nr:hypothetical protein J6590_005631 [Homalodisca vitripennis]